MCIFAIRWRILAAKTTFPCKLRASPSVGGPCAILVPANHGDFFKLFVFLLDFMNCFNTIPVSALTKHMYEAHSTCVPPEREAWSERNAVEVGFCVLGLHWINDFVQPTYRPKGTWRRWALARGDHPLGAAPVLQKDHQDWQSDTTSLCASRHGSEDHSRSKFLSRRVGLLHPKHSPKIIKIQGFLGNH